jgi:hypothetical protein
LRVSGYDLGTFATYITAGEKARRIFPGWRGFFRGGGEDSGTGRNFPRKKDSLSSPFFMISKQSFEHLHFQVELGNEKEILISTGVPAGAAYLPTISHISKINHHRTYSLI